MRSISAVTRDIVRDWKDPNFAARPYINAMLALGTMRDNYGLDEASDVVARFLCNAGTWRGEVARKCKAELNTMLKEHRRQRKE